MPRDANGNYTLPAGNPVVSGEVVSTAWGNPTMSDIAVELTSSLDRNGKGGMLAPFKFLDGSEGAPGLTFTSDPAMGFYRAGVKDLRASVGGDKMRWTDTGIDVSPDDGTTWYPLITDGDPGLNFLPLTGGTITGTLDVDGAVNFDSTLNVEGATTIDDTLLVTGTSNFQGAVDFDGNVNIDGTLNVEGATTVDDALGVTGALTVNGGITQTSSAAAASFNEALLSRTGAGGTSASQNANVQLSNVTDSRHAMLQVLGSGGLQMFTHNGTSWAEQARLGYGTGATAGVSIFSGGGLALFDTPNSNNRRLSLNASNFINIDGYGGVLHNKSSADLGGAVTQDTAAPGVSAGVEGDIWLQYTP